MTFSNQPGFARHLVVLLNVQKDENVHVAFKNCWYCIVLIFCTLILWLVVVLKIFSSGEQRPFPHLVSFTRFPDCKVLFLTKIDLPFDRLRL